MCDPRAPKPEMVAAENRAMTYREMSSFIDEMKIKPSDMNDAVQVAMVGVASKINKGGKSDQLTFLISHFGRAEAERQIREIAAAKNDDDDDDDDDEYNWDDDDDD